MSDLRRKLLRHQDVAITILVVAALLCLGYSINMLMRTDPSHSTDVYAYISSPETIVILHASPDEEAGINSVLNHGDRVLVETYDPNQNPTWAFVSRGQESGWIQLINLRQDPPS